ncbi:MAG: hypothetical protein RLZZ293_1408 [Pseudomonadota bacterium]|jgi:4-hydroxy-3-polyprenylbenzoate decarboxylase
MTKKITVAITGASGMPFALRLLEVLLLADCKINLVISKAGSLTLHHEVNLALSANPNSAKSRLLEHLHLVDYADRLTLYAVNDWFAPIASGSSVDEAMVVCPCSMASLAKIAHGIADDLISRSADVILKERKNLIIVPRETPLSALHLEHMLKLARLGVAIIPPVPAFYTQPQTISDIIDFVVSRILDQLGLDNQLTKRW